MPTLNMSREFLLGDKVHVTTHRLYRVCGKITAVTYTDPRLYDVYIDNTQLHIQYVEQGNLEIINDVQPL